MLVAFIGVVDGDKVIWLYKLDNVDKLGVAHGLASRPKGQEGYVDCVG